jgi:hypothetical protein
METPPQLTYILSVINNISTRKWYYASVTRYKPSTTYFLTCDGVAACDLIHIHYERFNCDDWVISRGGHSKVIDFSDHDRVRQTTTRVIGESR